MKRVVFVLCCLASVAWAADEDMRYPTTQRSVATQEPPLIVRPKPAVHRVKPIINWLKPTRIKVPKQIELPGKTVKDPRKPLHLPKYTPFQQRWDYIYKSDNITLQLPLTGIGLIDRKSYYHAPVIKVEMRDLPPIKEASMSAISSTLLGAFLAVAVSVWYFRHRPNLTLFFKRGLNSYVDTIEQCWWLCASGFFETDREHDARARRTRDIRRNCSGIERAYQVACAFRQDRRVHVARREDFVREDRHDDQDDSLIATLGRAISAEESRSPDNG